MTARRRLGALALVGAALTGLVRSPAAEGHVGAQVQLYAAAARLEPRTGGAWALAVELRDLDSGRPEAGFAVSVRTSAAGRSSGPVTLSEPGHDGRYVADLTLEPGVWTLTVAAEEIPGGNPALPFSRTWTDVALRPGLAVDLAGGSPGGDGPSLPAGLPLVAATAGAAVAAALHRRGRGRRSDPCPVMTHPGAGPQPHTEGQQTSRRLA